MPAIGRPMFPQGQSQPRLHDEHQTASDTEGDHVSETKSKIYINKKFQGNKVYNM